MRTRSPSLFVLVAVLPVAVHSFSCSNRGASIDRRLTKPTTSVTLQRRAASFRLTSIRDDDGTIDIDATSEVGGNAATTTTYAASSKAAAQLEEVDVEVVTLPLPSDPNTGETEGGSGGGGKSLNPFKGLAGMFKGTVPDPEPPMPLDAGLRSLAEQFKLPRIITKNFFVISLLLDLKANGAAPASLVAKAAAGAKPWFLTMYLLSASLDHTGRAAKLDRLNHPEVKLLNLGTVLSGLLLVLGSSAAKAVEAGAVGGASVLAKFASACPKVPLSIIIIFALPAIRCLFRTGVSGVVPLFGRVLEGLKTELVPGEKEKEAERGDSGVTRSTSVAKVAEKEGSGNYRMLSVVYGVLALESLASCLSKPASLPFLRASVLAVLHRNAFDANPTVLSSYKFKMLNDGLLTATIGMFSTTSGGRVVPFACMAASMMGSNAHKTCTAEAEQRKTEAAAS